MKKFVPYRKRLAMKNQIVVATGCCGTGDGVEIIGELTQVSPHPIVRVTNRVNKYNRAQLFEVDQNTLRLLEDEVTLPKFEGIK